jgi:hypothetical protein
VPNETLGSARAARSRTRPRDRRARRARRGVVRGVAFIRGADVGPALQERATQRDLRAYNATNTKYRDFLNRYK